MTWETPDAVYEHMEYHAIREAWAAKLKAEQAQLLHEAVTQGDDTISASAAAGPTAAAAPPPPSSASELYETDSAKFIDPKSEGSVRQQALMDKEAAAALQDKTTK